MVLPYINMNLPRVYTCSPSRNLLPPPSSYHPSGSSQCTSPEHSVSCIEPGLVICFMYDNIYASMLFSRQEHPPHREGCHLGMTFSHMKRISQLLHFKEQLLGGRSIRPDQKLQVKSWNKVVLFRKNLWEKARVGWFKRIALKHIYYHMWNRLPVLVHECAQGWCTGMNQRDGMGREVGRGFRMGNTCTPMADSCRRMAKPIRYCKLASN